MIRHRDTILLEEIPAFTQLHLDNPLKDPLELPSDACYLYIEKGSGHTLFKPGNITSTPGTVILSTCGLTAGRVISEQPTGAMDTIVVHLNQKLLSEVFEGEKPAFWKELQKPINQYVVQNAAGELVQAYFLSLSHLFQNKAALTDTLLKIKLKEIILLLLQTESYEPVLQIIRNLFSEKTFSFKEVVEAHIFSAISVENLALLTHCSLSTFKRKFKEIYGNTPAKYLMEKRLEKVAELLRISDDPVSHIGYDLGFESPEHLSRAFKKKYGLSPSAYRLDFSVR